MVSLDIHHTSLTASVTRLRKIKYLTVLAELCRSTPKAFSQSLA
jgi:hypothetical protein